MRLSVRPSGPLTGRLAVPGDKSISHRALILGALAGGEVKVRGLLDCRSTRATADCLRTLGVELEARPGGEWRIRSGGGESWTEPDRPLDARGSATTLRLLAGALAARPFLTVLTGSRALRGRPMGRIVEPLRQMGAEVLARAGGTLPPLAIRGGRLRGIDHESPVASAQVKSCLLLAGLGAEGPTRITEPGASRDHTERLLARMGAEIEHRPGEVTLRPGAPLSLESLEVPGDFSTAAFPMAAAILVPGSRLVLERVGINPTRTGLWRVLRRMGLRGRMLRRRDSGGEPVADLEVESSELTGTEVSPEEVPGLIDELPLLAVLASRARGITRVRGARELRHKESDRIATTAGELRRLGAEIRPLPDGFEVEGPRELTGAAVRGRGDHRLAMALGVAGMVAPGETVVSGAGCIEDSVPGGWAGLWQGVPL